MKKPGKRILSAVLAAVMTFQTLPFSALRAFAEMTEPEQEAVYTVEGIRDTDETFVELLPEEICTENVPDKSGEEVIIPDEPEETEEAAEAEVESEKYECTDETEKISFSFTNPLYDVDEELLAPEVYLRDSTPYFSNTDDLIEYIHTMLIRRETQIPFTVAWTGSVTNELLEGWFSRALVHDGNPKGGDYLAYQYGGYNATGSMTSTSVSIFLAVTYYDNAVQERTLDTMLRDVMQSLNLDGKSEYRKIKAIYDYVCRNVEYDYDNLNDSSYMLKYTAYAALVNGTAVCQGYANLIYRMMLTRGIDCRIVAGLGNGGAHAWNIVKIGNVYYDMDATWDAGLSRYNYFLKCDDNFDSHVRQEFNDIDYTSREFYRAYPMSETDYVPTSCETTGQHTWSGYTSDGNASCTKDGTKTARCSVCGRRDTVTDEGTATGHSFTIYISNNDATCTRDGTKTAICDNGCGEEDITEDTGSMLGHSFTAYLPDYNASCLTDGTKTAYCDNGCGEADTVANPDDPALGHDYEDIVVPATCQKYGYHEMVCQGCEEGTEGHSYTDETDENLWYYSHLDLDYNGLCDACEQTIMVSDGLWCREIPDMTYTGSRIKPVVYVYNGETLLTLGKDYTVTYKNNTKRAASDAVNTKEQSIAPTVVITGKGNYSGKLEKTFNILKKDIDTCDITDYKGLFISYTGKTVTPKIVIKYGKLTLKQGTDYDLVYDKQSAEGIYDIRVVGKGNYTGTIEGFYVITKNNLTKATVSAIKDQVYTGEEIYPVFTVKVGTKVLQPGVDYSYWIENNVEIGTATVHIEGTGDYENMSLDSYYGYIEKTFKIKGIAISGRKVTGVVAKTYDGTSHTQELCVTMGTGANLKTLTEGTDYTVTYQNNVNQGTAKILITGIGNYTGTKTVTFKINKRNITDTSYAALNDQVKYLKGGATTKAVVTYNGMTLKEGTDYTLKYTNNKKVLDKDEVNAKGQNIGPYMTITGKGNYQGSVKVYYSITPSDIGSLAISTTDIFESTGANKYRTTVKITDNDGKVLTAGTDYEKVFVYSKNGVVLTSLDRPVAGDKITVTVQGKGNYTGTISGTYKILRANKNIARATVTVQKGLVKTYTGRPVEIDKSEFTVKIGTQVLDPSAYEIVESRYENNINKGTAKVTIQGVGEYGGVKTFTFKIGSQGLIWDIFAALRSVA